MLATVWWFCLILYVPASIGLIIVVLLQKGKGTGFAGAFGMGGGGDAVFGPRSGKSLPQRLTTLMAALFMVLALVMSLIGGRISAGSAPEKVDETNYKSSANSALGDLGLGTGKIDETREIKTDAVVETTDVSVPEVSSENTTTEASISAEVVSEDFTPETESAISETPVEGSTE